MNAISHSNKSTPYERVIGNLTGTDGPTIVFIGGIHGNEPSGVIALRQVFDELNANQTEIRGRVLGLAGNLPALVENKRFISQDLNRIWNSEFSKRFQRGEGNDATSEFKDQRELFEIISPLLQNQSPVFFIDLHTTSSRSTPFIAVNDQIDNREFAFQFPVPTVLGIEEHLEGPLLSYLNDFGRVAMAFEAGQHDDPESVEIHSSFVYLAMLAAGVIGEDDVEKINVHRQRLDSMEQAQNVFEVIFRRAISLKDEFRMKPGFLNFMPVKKGEVLAEDRNGPISAARNGCVFMPLYQTSGNDGFFIVRSVPMWALKLSTVIRKINFERLLVWFPGVSKNAAYPDALIVNKKIAFFMAIELFHLLGYRRKQIVGHKMIFSRREIDGNKNPGE